MVDDEIDLESLCVAADVEFWHGRGEHATLSRLLHDVDWSWTPTPVR